ncbi:ribonuclease R family protein, partial [Fundidesulfovibrio magnetotacticus]|uniref:ribonuclease R family protein n=1 Tax=Fundidesulfovibrio magnetotacticus TaxID=2730080 RepID=UPI0015657459
MSSKRSDRMAKRARKTGHVATRMDEASLLALFKERGRPLTVKDVLAGLGAHKVQKAQALHLLETLTQSGRIIRIQGAWGLAESMRLVTGRLEVQRSGVGYVILDDKRRKDVFVNPRDFGLAWHGDRVAVALTRHGGRNPEGRVVRVLERGVTAMPCRVERLIKPGLALCRPTDPRHLHALLLETEPGGRDPAPGDVLTLEAGEMLDHQLFAARLVESLGRETDLAVQERMVKLNHQIPGPFPERCLEQAAQLPAAPGEADLPGRQDLRGLDFVTIDGETARDFDDAILVEEDGKGFLLRVAIADVAHYVPAGSPLDREAMERGNSCYFPLSVEPMFPEALSNGLCSLNPGVDRLAMAVAIRFDASGLPGRCDFASAVIRSKARLTYEQVHAALEENGPEREALVTLMPMLRRAETLARAIRARREERGSLDFELPEPEIRLDPASGEVDIRARERRFSHRIIEEFMIAANEAVARHLTEHGAPLPYRVHPEPDPDKLETLFGVLSRTELGLSLPSEPT